MLAVGFAEARTAETGGKNRSELPFEKKILTTRLGMAPEVLSRALASLVAAQRARQADTDY